MRFEKGQKVLFRFSKVSPIMKGKVSACLAGDLFIMIIPERDKAGKFLPKQCKSETRVPVELVYTRENPIPSHKEHSSAKIIGCILPEFIQEKKEHESFGYRTKDCYTTGGKLNNTMKVPE